MRTIFIIDYPTRFGQDMLIEFTGTDLSVNNCIPDIRQMTFKEGVWVYISDNIDLECTTYRYKLKDENSDIINEAGINRSINYVDDDFDNNYENLTLYDHWRDYTDETPFYSSAFTDVLFKKERSLLSPKGSLVINVYSPNLDKNSEVVISGNNSYLGNWDPEKSHKMYYCGGGLWSIGIDTTQYNNLTEFKFLIKRFCDDCIDYQWEDGTNRTIYCSCNNKIILNCNRVNIKVNRPRIAGTAIPLFSLKSKESCGIGDFGDLYKMIDLLYETSQNILQLLPINDTTSTHSIKDTYPYNSISTFALHPLYLNLKMAGKLSDKKFTERFDRYSGELNALPYLDYCKVEAHKWSYIKKLFIEIGRDVLESDEFKDFYKRQSYWLDPYALFCSMKDLNDTADFRKWSKKISPDATKYLDDINLYKFVQFLLYKQLKEVREYASDKGIILKGDLPIGISRNSVDAWVYPSLFNFDMQSGAPPDDFSDNGQNWGFPTYNWDIMSKDGFSWWRKRFSYMSEFFDAIRIDHILGFFRMWEIPVESESALYGSFNPSLSYNKSEISSFGFSLSEINTIIKNIFIADPRNSDRYIPFINGLKSEFYTKMPDIDKKAFQNIFNHYYFYNNESFWSKNGFVKLQDLITFSGMLICAEDLGMIPDCVPKVLKNFRILSLEIPRFPKDLPPDYYSVSTTSTHDTSTLKGWIDETKSTCSPTDLIFNILSQPSVITIIPIQDWFSLSDKLSGRDPAEERINIPSDPDHNWNYRIHKTIEEIMDDNLFKNSVKKAVLESGRALQI